MSSKPTEFSKENPGHRVGKLYKVKYSPWPHSELWSRYGVWNHEGQDYYRISISKFKITESTTFLYLGWVDGENKYVGPFHWVVLGNQHGVIDHRIHLEEVKEGDE